MSKAFTSEETPDEPVVVRPRAPLPEDAQNYVTSHGLALLHEELAQLEKARANIVGDDVDKRRAAEALGTQLDELAERIASAVVVDTSSQSKDEARFGAYVTLADEEGRERIFQIVGVDEADAKNGKIAFVAPLARAVLGRRVGDELVVRLPNGEESFELLAIRYDLD